MFEIKKEVVNAIGNVQSSEHIGFVDCNEDDVINRLSKIYCNLARASTLYYKLRGKPYTVRYVFIYKNLASIADAVKFAKTNITARVDEANEYINTANAAYKESNKKRGLRNKSLILKPIDIRDFMWVDKAGVDKDGYCLMLSYGDKCLVLGLAR